MIRKALVEITWRMMYLAGIYGTRHMPWFHGQGMKYPWDDVWSWWK